MKRIAILAGSLPGLLAGPALAVTMLTPPVTMGENLRLRCNISNLSSYSREGTVCSVSPFVSGNAGHLCHTVQLGPGQAYASPALAVEGSFFCRFTMSGTRSNFVAVGIVDTGANVPLVALPAD